MGLPLTYKLMMYFVYLLKSKKDNSLYIGYTTDLKKRLLSHNSRQNTSTKNKAPYELAYCEVYKSQSDAKYREKNLKKFAQAYTQLKRRIKNSLI